MFFVQRFKVGSGGDSLSFESRLSIPALTTNMCIRSSCRARTSARPGPSGYRDSVQHACVRTAFSSWWRMRQSVVTGDITAIPLLTTQRHLSQRRKHAGRAAAYTAARSSAVLQLATYLEIRGVSRAAKPRASENSRSSDACHRVVRPPLLQTRCDGGGTRCSSIAELPGRT